MDLHKEQRVTISLRVPVTLRDKLKEKAEESYRPISSEIRMLIISGMNNLYREKSSSIKYYVITNSS